MNRVGRRNLSLNHNINDDDEDDEEKLYERQALISDEEINDHDEGLNQFIVRHRSQTDKRISPYANGHELKNFNGHHPLDDPPPPIEFTNYDIQPGDTLQSICLRYACPVNQVKRLNGLINDQEFYGLRVLKLPLGKMGLLDELLKQQQQTNSGADLLDHNNHDSLTPSTFRKTMNSPGSALSISVGRLPTTSNFIKSDLDDKANQITVDNLLTDSDPVIQNVFEDLDYHVEMAKAATETQDQRVTELVDTIAINNPSNGTNVVRPAKRVSKIPELFFSVPLVYLNQTSQVVSHHHYIDSANQNFENHKSHTSSRSIKNTNHR